ncbi:MAG: hypothetical protein JO360_11780 [Acidobacteria bacterium]|nr:hypothetical protein [Acidobacteriota bacterium]
MSKSLVFSALLALSGWSLACTQTTNTNTNTSTANVNATPAANINTSATPAPGASIEAREPDKYQAKLSLTAQTTGSGNNISIPALGSEVARNGADRRVSLTLPGGEQVIYLDRTDKRYIILPKRKQYAELTPESTGFEVPRMMTPAEVVEQVKKLQGFERVGEEQTGGRTAIKYRYAGTSKTGTQAGDVQTESIVLVDKETGLPLRSETVSESQTGNVKGITGLKVVTEMTDIRTDVDPTMFEVPQGYSKVSDQQVRQSVDAVGRAVIAIVGQLMQSASNNSAPAASPTASASVSPAAK